MSWPPLPKQGFRAGYPRTVSGVRQTVHLGHEATHADDFGRVRVLLLVSVGCLVARWSVSRYVLDSDADGFLLLVELLLLWLVYSRRSRVARILFVLPALAGAIVFVLVTLAGYPQAGLVALLLLGEAVPLLLGPVRRHVLYSS